MTIQNKRGISLAYADLEVKSKLAHDAEQAGFDVIWNSGESIPLFGSIAKTTQSTPFGSGVIRAFAHDLRELAQSSVDLQRLSGNRFILGLGGGTKRMNINQLGKEFDRPATRLREMIKGLKIAWSTPYDEDIDFQGDYYSMSGKGLRGVKSDSGLAGFKGDSSNPPPIPALIYLAAVNKAMFRLAGDLCDGLCGHPIASVKFINETAWPSIDEGIKRSNRTRSDFDHNAWIVTAISSNKKQAEREAKYHIARFMATRSYGIVLDSQGYSDIKEKIQNEFFNNPNDHDALINAVPDDIAKEHSIYGNIDQVREQAEKYDGVVNTSTFYCASALMSHERIHENLQLMIEAFGKN
jgi:alkanesulfonate monooxygenase SsuD/methylene tetrahydromethanopterin reductase-like flavin-dependent oxidoreductase (luciferase family)